MIFNKEQRTELWYTLKNNKRRSIVTSLGVFAGMFFFTVLISLGEGIDNSVNQTLKGVSQDFVVLMGGRTTKPYDGYKANRMISPTYKDYLDLKAHARKIKDVSCSAGYHKDGLWQNVLVSLKGQTRYVYVVGVSENYSKIQQNVVVYGRDLRSDEILDGVTNCVIGEKLAERFVYDDVSQVVGSYIMTNGVPFRVVGVVKPFTDSFNVMFNPSWSIQIPLSIAVRNDLYKPVLISVNPMPGVTEEEVINEAKQVVYRNHHVDPTEPKVVNGIGMSLFNNVFKMIATGINILIWVVGMGTLVTGVISVSNILLVTVRERQREIGVRRAIGAKPADIRAQFMLEAIVIIFVAGSIGIILGLLVSLGLGAISENVPKVSDYLLRPYPPIHILILSVVIMLVAGVFAGLLPVYKALQIKAIDAIRDE